LREADRRTLEDALDVARAAKKAGIPHGVVKDKLFLAGPAQAQGADRFRLLRRILAVRGEFGYWVFEATGSRRTAVLELPQKDGGGIILEHAVSLALRAR